MNIFAFVNAGIHEKGTSSIISNFAIIFDPN